MNPKKFFFILSAILGIIFVAGGYGYYTASQYLNSRTEAYSKKLADKQLSEDEISQLEDLKSQFKKLEADIDLIETALPKDAQQAQLTLQLQNIANQSGMSISEINFPDTSTVTKSTKTKVAPKKEDTETYSATFNLSGSYSQLQAFLQRQEKLSRYTNVLNLGISTDEKTKGLIFVISLNAYIKP